MAVRGDGTVSPEDWDLVRKIFDEALDVPRESRLDWLGRLDAPTGVVAEVARLLKHREKAGPDLDKSPLEALREGRKAKNIFVAGQVVAERFLVDSFLGRGGMGEVYAAMDTESRERIALKVIAGAAVEEQEAQARLRRELLTARKVTHPNVCRVHDLARHDGMLCLTMELLDGETLAQALARGPLDVARAAGIARQIAAGLGAAHAAGVLHRDLKPSNVMLGTGRVVLMDFGLAKSVGGLFSSITASGTILGTPDYMAPEQVEGGRATERTDIYAFGLILYEMLTGRKAFVGDTPLAAAMQRVKREAPRLADAYPELWRDVVARCLERDAERRFASAEEVRAALDGEIAAGRRDALLTKRRAVIFASGLGGVSLFAGGWRLWEWKEGRGGGLAAGFTVMLADLENLTGETQFIGVSELCRNQLQQSARFNVLEPSRVDAMIRQMNRSGDQQPPEVLREAAWRLQVPALVFGHVAKVAGDYVLTLQLETRGTHPQAPRTKSVKSFSSASREGVMRMVRDAGNWIRQVSGESVAEIERQDLLPEDVTTPSWEAFQFYAVSERLARQGKVAEAVASLGTALERDPEFTLAAMRRGDHLMSLYRNEEGMLAWQEAVRLLGKRRVTRREELRIRGMFAFDSGSLLESDKYFSQWAAEFPHDHRGYFYRTIPLLLYDRAADAIENLRHASAITPGRASTHAQIFNCAVLMRDWAQCNEAIGRMRDAGEIERPLFKEGVLQFCRMDFAGAGDSFRRLRESKQAVWQVRATLYEGLLLAETGRGGEAIRVVERGIAGGTRKESEVDQANLRLALGWLLLEKGLGREVRALAKEALALERGHRVSAHAGSLLARTGDMSLVNEILDRVEPLRELTNYRRLRHRLRGELSSQRGEREEARKEFGAASGLEPPLAYKEYLLREGVTTKEGQSAVLRNIALHPSLLWLEPMTERPGVWGEAVKRMPPAIAGKEIAEYRQALVEVAPNSGAVR
ncbi:MAG: serine/threonine-protein kinase [Bryobacteraceae bacterium]